jgi:GDP-4-dehydro-6-deoxy-D-mannose reductase
MRAVVTGARGFVGTHLVETLRRAGWSVLTLDRRGPADVTGDLLRAPLRGLRADVVFHLAGFAQPGASAEAARECFETNAAATARLLREAPAGRFVVASTAHVYAAAPRPVDEDARLDPRTPYAASKLCGEALARASGRDVVVLRPFNHTGPGQSDAYVCPRIARRIARAEAGLAPPVLELGALAPRFDCFDVRDMARAYLLAAERAPAGSTYNVGTGRPVAVGELARLLLSMSRRPLRLEAEPGEPSTRSGDASRFRAAVGWRPLLPLRRTLADLLEHERRAVRASPRT